MYKPLPSCVTEHAPERSCCTPDEQDADEAEHDQYKFCSCCSKSIVEPTQLDPLPHEIACHAKDKLEDASQRMNVNQRGGREPRGWEGRKRQYVCRQDDQ